MLREHHVLGHRVDDPGPGVQTGEGEREEAHHGPEGHGDSEEAHAVDLRQHRQGQGDGVERGAVVPGAEHLDVTHEHHERPGDKQAHDHGPGDVLERILGLAPESGRTLEADEREDADHHGQAESVEGHTLRLHDGGVDREAVLEQDHGGEGQDAGHRDDLEHQGEQRGHMDVLVGDEPADACRQDEVDHGRHRAVHTDARQELLRRRWRNPPARRRR